MTGADGHRGDDHGHAHGHGHSHGHSHGGVNAAVLGSERGLWALKWSLAGLGATASLQLVVVIISGSVALLADTIHNFGDALSAVPLGAAFILSRRPPTRRFPYGLHRSEDLAGLAIVGLILISAIVAGYLSIQRLIHPQAPTALPAVAIAGLIGFVGNEAIAQFRISVGRKIGSAALIADGHHARVDGFTSLAVVVGAAGAALGAPIADPIVGLGITLVILRITWTAAKEIGERILDGVDPGILEQIETVATRTPGVRDVGEVRARWLGHTLRIEVNVAVDDNASVSEGHDVATRLRSNLQDEVEFFGEAVVHIDPESQAGEAAHDRS